ncbi:hypothetical protein F383_13426 [Gossypium arboreum]|uniref:Uncharacterized protein n=1 Tax=Gossypium arboreum TaxID=29729 RepID=A0A0B0PQV1_GOSAR|nr:hypothetical protein F383_13426 [Gossypium arboreum]
MGQHTKSTRPGLLTRADHTALSLWQG